jgi:hypothetical protein
MLLGSILGGAVIGAGIGAGISYLGCGNTSDILWAAGKGALIGGIGGALLPFTSSLSASVAGVAGLSGTSALWASAVGTNVITGAILGMLDAYMEDKDIFEGATTGVIFGLIFAPLSVYGGQISNKFGSSWKEMTEKMTKYVNDFFHAGRGKPVGLGRKLLRLVWEDRKTFNASRDFFKRWRSERLTFEDWSMEHMIIKQRCYRGENPFQNATLKRILQGIGDSESMYYLSPILSISIYITVKFKVRCSIMVSTPEQYIQSIGFIVSPMQ